MLCVITLTLSAIIDSKLQDGARKIEKGRRQIQDGEEKLNSWYVSIGDWVGIDKIEEGKKKLKEGKKELEAGIQKFKKWKSISRQLASFFNSFLYLAIFVYLVQWLLEFDSVTIWINEFRKNNDLPPLDVN